MAARPLIALILGAGPNIGQAVARKFASEGYKVALAARSLKEADSTDTQLNISTDFSNTDGVVYAFEKTRDVFGIPSVVVYNVSVAHFTHPQDPFSLPLTDLISDMTVNIHGLFTAAQQAVSGFAQLPQPSSAAAAPRGTFITTGNVLNTAILPRFMSQGVGKSAAAHMIWAASEAYKDVGYRFYYADERKPDGAPKYRVDGEAHAELYWGLASEPSQGPWHQTFVKGEGYKRFDSIYQPVA